MPTVSSESEQVAAGFAVHLPDDADRDQSALQAFGRRCIERADVIGWVLGAVLAVVVLENMRAPRTFWFDEWTFVLERRGWGLDQFLQPHNGHLSAIPVSAFKSFFAIFGLDHYRPYRVLGLLVHAGVATSVFLYARARLGSLAGAGVGLLVLFLGVGWQNIFWPFQIGMMGSVLFGVVAWMLLDRTTPASDLLASACLGAALACSGIGVALIGGTFFRLFIDRRWGRLLRVTAPPMAIYVSWYLVFGEDQGRTDDISEIPGFVLDEAAAALNGLAGLGLDEGRMGIAVFVFAAVAVVAGTRRVRLAALGPAAALTLNLVLIGYSRAQYGEPDASRYLYVNGVLLLLLASDLLEPLRSVWVECLVVGTMSLCVWGSWGILNDGANGLRESSATTRVELRALEWAGASVDPAFQPDSGRMPQVAAGNYLDAVEELGSPAAGNVEVLMASDADRFIVDDVSIRALRIGLKPGEVDVSEVELRGDGRMVLIGTECAVVVPASDGANTVAVAMPSGSSIDVFGVSSVEVRLRRYAAAFPDEAVTATVHNEAATLSIPADQSPIQTWFVDLRSSVEFTVCGIGP